MSPETTYMGDMATVYLQGGSGTSIVAHVYEPVHYGDESTISWMMPGPRPASTTVTAEFVLVLREAIRAAEELERRRRK